MRIRLRELKNIIKKILREAYDTPTISSDLDPSEKEFQQKYPRWGSPHAKRDSVKHASPAEIKAKKVVAILQAKGLTANAEHKKKITQSLLSFIEKMDPGDMFVADADSIAADFAEDVLGVRRD
jgi:hypothetical protein